MSLSPEQITRFNDAVRNIGGAAIYGQRVLAPVIEHALAKTADSFRETADYTSFFRHTVLLSHTLSQVCTDPEARHWVGETGAAVNKAFALLVHPESSPLFKLSAQEKGPLIGSFMLAGVSQSEAIDVMTHGLFSRETSWRIMPSAPTDKAMAQTKEEPLRELAHHLMDAQFLQLQTMRFPVLDPNLSHSFVSRHDSPEQPWGDLSALARIHPAKAWISKVAEAFHSAPSAQALPRSICLSLLRHMFALARMDAASFHDLTEPGFTQTPSASQSFQTLALLVGAGTRDAAVDHAFYLAQICGDEPDDRSKTWRAKRWAELFHNFLWQVSGEVLQGPLGASPSERNDYELLVAGAHTLFLAANTPATSLPSPEVPHPNASTLPIEQREKWSVAETLFFQDFCGQWQSPFQIRQTFVFSPQSQTDHQFWALTQALPPVLLHSSGFLLPNALASGLLSLAHPSTIASHLHELLSESARSHSQSALPPLPASTVLGWAWAAEHAVRAHAQAHTTSTLPGANAAPVPPNHLAPPEQWAGVFSLLSQNDWPLQASEAQMHDLRLEVNAIEEPVRTWASAWLSTTVPTEGVDRLVELCTNLLQTAQGQGLPSDTSAYWENNVMHVLSRVEHTQLRATLATRSADSSPSLANAASEALTQPSSQAQGTPSRRRRL